MVIAFFQMFFTLLLRSFLIKVLLEELWYIFSEKIIFVLCLSLKFVWL